VGSSQWMSMEQRDNLLRTSFQTFRASPVGQRQWVPRVKKRASKVVKKMRARIADYYNSEEWKQKEEEDRASDNRYYDQEDAFELETLREAIMKPERTVESEEMTRLEKERDHYRSLYEDLLSRGGK
jgi:hypothetical protein